MAVDADICIYCCTGRQGTAVTRWIIKLASNKHDRPLTLLLAGRNVAKVQELQTKLLTEENTKNNVNIVVHSEPVDVNNEDAIRIMVARARVVANCIDVNSHPRAILGVAEACAQAGADYLDFAPRRDHLESLFDHGQLQAVCKSRIVPGCGFDYAFFDIPVFLAEQAFAQRYNCKPDKVQLTLALQTGPLGIKWPLRLAKQYFESEALSKPKTIVSRQRSPTTLQKSHGGILAYSNQLSVWSIPWPLAGDAITYLLGQRGDWSPDNVDPRIGLPRKLWKAATLVLYGMVVAAIFLPIMSVARFAKIRVFQQFLLWILPAVTLGFLCNDDELCRESIKQMRVELVIILKNSSKGCSLCYHVLGPSPDILNPLCMALACLELLGNDTNTRGGVLTPAMAMGETSFWSCLQKVCDTKVQISAE